MNRISDFKLAEYIIRLLCKQANCPFVDLVVELSNIDGAILVGGTLHIPKSDRLSKTIFHIATGYLQNMRDIAGATPVKPQDQITAINMITAVLRDLTYSEEFFPESLEGLPVELKLNRDPFTWMILRDIVCPAFNKPVKNINVIAGKSATLDVAKLLMREHLEMEIQIGAGVKASEEDTPYLFVNMEIENYACRLAFILHEAIKAHDLDAGETIRALLTKTELSKRFLGSVRMALEESTAIHAFLTTLGILIGFQAAETALVIEKNAKMGRMTGIWAQSQTAPSFWQLGLIEKMLEPDRGMDWSVYERMKPFTDQLWEKIEAEKRKRGLKELPMELLLRVQSDKFKTDPNMVIQGLLADNRVW